MRWPSSMDLLRTPQILPRPLEIGGSAQLREGAWQAAERTTLHPGSTERTCRRHSWPSVLDHASLVSPGSHTRRGKGSYGISTKFGDSLSHRDLRHWGGCGSHVARSTIGTQSSISSQDSEGDHGTSPAKTATRERRPPRRVQPLDRDRGRNGDRGKDRKGGRDKDSKGDGDKDRSKGSERSDRKTPRKGARGREEQVQEASLLTPAKFAAMASFAAEEKLLFEKVPAQQGAITCIYAYPNEYSVGICSLGYQLVWAYLATRADVHVSRLFTNAAEPVPRGGRGGAHALPDLVGFSLSWELDIVNLLSMLDAMGVPRRAQDRLEAEGTMGGAGQPGCTLVFGGGAVLSANPEPYADFFDVVLMGDGEELLGSFLDAFQAVRSSGLQSSRLEMLQALAMVPGVYVPALYRVEYAGPTGPILSIQPVSDCTPASVVKQTYRGKTLASSSVVSKLMAWPDIFMLEVVRGCPEMCRFCLASYSSLPFRAPLVEDSLLPLLEKGLQVTDRIGLLGASVTQHPQFHSLLSYLLQPQYRHVRLSISSVRTNTVTPELAAALAQSGTRSLTVAVESGSERLRDVVNKKLHSKEIYAAARHAQEGGLEGLKLYSMVGLPSETEEDVDATIAMMTRLREEAPRLHFTLGCSTFVPKAHTPFQWHPVRKEAAGRMERLEKAMRGLAVDFNPESYKWSVIQAVLSRGDRRLGRLLEAVKDYGGSQGSFRRAFKALEGTLPVLEFYAFRKIPESEVLPWSHIKGALSQDTLKLHADRSLSTHH